MIRLTAGTFGVMEIVNSENEIILTLYKLIETVGAKKKRAEKVGEYGETLAKFLSDLPAQFLIDLLKKGYKDPALYQWA
ncbi:40554_t:CDS:2, partial [Gigaspora margarita]